MIPEAAALPGWADEDVQEVKMTPFYSIIIPVYNVEAYLEESVRSVTGQIGPDTPAVELILVDDGSTDGSGERCDRIARECGKASVKVIHQENRGLLAARRAGYRAAGGEYILNLDSDDLLLEGALDAFTEAINHTKADMVFFNLSMMTDGGITPYYRDVFTEGEGCELTKEQVLHSYFTDSIPVVTSMCGKVFRRSCLDPEKDYAAYGKLSMGEDTLQTAEVVARAKSFYYLNRNLYAYRMGTGMTGRFDPGYYTTFKRILEDAWQVEGFADHTKCRKDYNDKILSSGCRAITQSKNAGLTYARAKEFMRSVAKDEAFARAMAEMDPAGSSLKKKYRMMIRLLRMRAYFPLYLALRALG